MVDESPEVLPPTVGGAAAGLSGRELLALLGEDLRVHRGEPMSAGFHVVAVQRLGAWGRSLPSPWRRLVLIVHAMLYVIVRNVYGVEVSSRACLGRRVFIAHHAGVHVDLRAVIGDDVKIRQNVTIGKGDSTMSDAAPTIGAGVSIGAGAVIVGDLTVGAGAVIGPNAVVVTDVAPGATVFAPPARHMKAPTGRGPES